MEPLFYDILGSYIFSKREVNQTGCKRIGCMIRQKQEHLGAESKQLSNILWWQFAVFFNSHHIQAWSEQLFYTRLSVSHFIDHYGSIIKCIVKHDISDVLLKKEATCCKPSAHRVCLYHNNIQSRIPNLNIETELHLCDLLQEHSTPIIFEMDSLSSRHCHACNINNSLEYVYFSSSLSSHLFVSLYEAIPTKLCLFDHISRTIIVIGSDEEIELLFSSTEPVLMKKQRYGDLPLESSVCHYQTLVNSAEFQIEFRFDERDRGHKHRKFSSKKARLVDLFKSLAAGKPKLMNGLNISKLEIIAYQGHPEMFGTHNDLREIETLEESNAQKHVGIEKSEGNEPGRTEVQSEHNEHAPRELGLAGFEELKKAVSENIVQGENNDAKVGINKLRVCRELQSVPLVEMGANHAMVQIHRSGEILSIQKSDALVDDNGMLLPCLKYKETMALELQKNLGVTTTLPLSEIFACKKPTVVRKVKINIDNDVEAESSSLPLMLEACPLEDNIVDLKQKTEITLQITSDEKIPLIEDYDQTNFDKKTDDSKDDYVHTVRKLVWLPSGSRPIPTVNAIVAVLFAPMQDVLKDMASGETPGPQITMRYELLRLCTLRNYPRNNKPYIMRLAQAGFYYASDGDEVVCYVCGLRRRNWSETDIPLEIHQRISPNCRFFTHNADCNVPVPDGPENEVDRFAFINDLMPGTGSTEAASGTTSHRTSEETRNVPSPATVSTRHTPPARAAPPAVREHSSSGRIAGTPKFPQYALRATRRATYNGWPDSTGQEIATLVDAGFYYAGIGDCIRCFFCGIGLRHWSSDDDVWIEHARWSRNCGYVLEVKGEEYVTLVHMAIQYTEEMEDQPGARGGTVGNIPPSDEIDRLLRSDAAQSVLEMGYQPRLLKRALEMVLREHGPTNIRAEMIMEKVLEIEDEDMVSSRMSDMHLDRTSSPNNLPHDTRVAASVRGSAAASGQGQESRHREASGQTGQSYLLDATPSASVPASESSNSRQSSLQTTSPEHGRLELNQANKAMEASASATSSGTGNSTQMPDREPGGNAKSDESKTSGPSGVSTAPSSEPVQLRSRSLDSLVNNPQSPEGNRRRHNSDERLSTTKSPDRDHVKNKRHLLAGQDTKSIRKENQQLREQTRCKVCMDKLVCIVFLPCGHLVTCADCAPAMRKCPVCRTLIKGTVKAFMS